MNLARTFLRKVSTLSYATAPLGKYDTFLWTHNIPNLLFAIYQLGYDVKGDAIAGQAMTARQLKGNKATRDPNAPKKSTSRGRIHDVLS